MITVDSICKERDEIKQLFDIAEKEKALKFTYAA